MRPGFKTVLPIAAFIIAVFPAAAQTPSPPAQPAAPSDARLKEVERAVDQARGRSQSLKQKAAGLDAEIQRLRRGMVDAARLTQEHERTVERLTLEVAQLEAAVNEKTETLKERRAQMGGILFALQRIARYPPEAVIAQPSPAGDTVRSAILLRAAVPELERRAAGLRDELASLARAREAAAQHKLELANAITNLTGERKLLRTLVGRKSRLRRRTVAESRSAALQARRLAKKAASLRDLIRGLEHMRREREARQRDAEEREQAAVREAKRRIAAKSTVQKTVKASKPDARSNPRTAKAPPTSPTRPPRGFTGVPIAQVRGRLPYPVVGRLIGRYGQRGQGGLTQKGITLNTARNAQVVAHYEGLIVFAGDFRGYGQLLIIEHGGGYHSLLAGMARIDAEVGQWVLAGEPVGVMDGSAGKRPALYVELRRNGQPINPLPWLVARKGKANG